MANTNSQAVRFCNERIRPFSDLGGALILRTNDLLKIVAAQNIGDLFLSKEDISDGSDQDGRSPLTNDDIKQFLSGLDAIAAFWDGNSALRDLLLRIAVNPERL